MNLFPWNLHEIMESDLYVNFCLPCNFGNCDNLLKAHPCHSQKRMHLLNLVSNHNVCLKVVFFPSPQRPQWRVDHGGARPAPKIWYHLWKCTAIQDSHGPPGAAESWHSAVPNQPECGWTPHTFWVSQVTKHPFLVPSCLQKRYWGSVWLEALHCYREVLI